ncbi:hypothetical protein GCM10027093_73640 [Paraburkholderia jirisanensis]
MVSCHKKRSAPELKICRGHCRDNGFGPAGFYETPFKLEQPRPMVRTRGQHETAQSWNEQDELLGRNGCEKRK